jgi:hypothetical protein
MGYTIRNWREIAMMASLTLSPEVRKRHITADDVASGGKEDEAWSLVMKQHSHDGSKVDEGDRITWPMEW